MSRVARPAIAELGTILGLMRPAGSIGEAKLIRSYIMPLGVSKDAYGNLYKRIGTAPILWSCHTDTVHAVSGTQRIYNDKGMISLSGKEKIANCLGADCGAGIWLMAQMIRAKKPGLYVFHREEESGGNGSNWIAHDNPKFLDGIDAAIAFDRRGNHSVITHQAGGRCCSQEFASALCRELGQGFKPDSGGTFTDTANYTDLIGECTNVSVGYREEHTFHESLDSAHLVRLFESIMALDTDKLPIKRKAGEWEESDWSFRAKSWSRYLYPDNDMMGGRVPSMHRLVQSHSDIIADYLEELGYTEEDIAEVIDHRGGIIRRT